MAKRKKRARSLAPRTTRKVKGIRRRRRTKKGFLGEFFTPESAREGARSTFSGFLGGGSSLAIDLAFPNQTDQMQGLIKAATGFGFATLMKMPYMGAGIAGAGGAQFFASIFGLSQGGANFADPLETMPMFLTENGDPATLAQEPYLLSQSSLLSEINKQRESIYGYYQPQYMNQ